jgi:hypothetical protein
MPNAYTSVAFDRFTAPSSSSGACQHSVPSTEPWSKEEGQKGDENNILAIGFLLLLDAFHFISLKDLQLS